MTYTYCSFADEEGFLGALILKGALDPGQAFLRAYALNLNPGGEMVTLQFEESDMNQRQQDLFLSAAEKRLLTAHELIADGAKTLGELESEASGEAS